MSCAPLVEAGFPGPRQQLSNKCRHPVPHRSVSSPPPVLRMLPVELCENAFGCLWPHFVQHARSVLVACVQPLIQRLAFKTQLACRGPRHQPRYYRACYQREHQHPPPPHGNDFGPSPLTMQARIAVEILPDFVPVPKLASATVWTAPSQVRGFCLYPLWVI